MEFTVGRTALTAACISKVPFAALTCMVNIPVCEKLSPFLKESVKKAKGMSSLNLMQEVVEKTSVVRRLVHELQPEDPLRVWFSLELDSLAIDSENEAQLSLDETHARLRALDQLQYLVFRHKVYLGNPEIEKDETDGMASLLTVEAAIPANVFESAEHLKFTIEPQLLHDPTQENNQFDPVSPTAKIVGYLRGQDQTLRLSDKRSRYRRWTHSSINGGPLSKSLSRHECGHRQPPTASDCRVRCRNFSERITVVEYMSRHDLH